MKILQEMLHRTTSIPEHKAMMRSVTPFFDCFNISQFYYTKILPSGASLIFGTHTELHEYLFDQTAMMKSCPVLRNPDVLKTGITFLKDTPDLTYRKFLDFSWNKFKVNFTINIQIKTSEGMESYGFGVKHNDSRANEHLLNELPLIHKFFDYFKRENKKLLQIYHDHQVDLSSLLGPHFNEAPNAHISCERKIELLKQFGLENALLLTLREREILKFLAYGYPASHISKELHNSYRTVENHIATIKLKLDCNSKVELIKKAQEIAGIINWL